MIDHTHDILDWIRSHYFGKYRGTVTDNRDDTSRGRLRVKVPAVLDTLEVWAMPCVPYAGEGVGFYSMPPSGAGVWIEFEGGDPSFPIWSGFFWADEEIPGDADPKVKIWATDSITMKLDDSSSEMEIKNTISTVTISQDISLESCEATLSVGVDGVVAEQGAGKLQVAVTGVILNDGVFEVV